MTSKEVLIRTWNIKWSSCGDDYELIINGTSPFSDVVLLKNGRRLEKNLIQNITIELGVNKTNKITVEYIPEILLNESWKDRFNNAMNNW